MTNQYSMAIYELSKSLFYTYAQNRKSAIATSATVFKVFTLTKKLKKSKLSNINDKYVSIAVLAPFWKRRELHPEKT